MCGWWVVAEGKVEEIVDFNHRLLIILDSNIDKFKCFLVANMCLQGSFSTE